jgi:hypothetical protein
MSRGLTLCSIIRGLFDAVCSPRQSNNKGSEGDYISFVICLTDSLNWSVPNRMQHVPNSEADCSSDRQKSPPFVETKISLTSQEQSAARLFPEPHKSNPTHSILIPLWSNLTSFYLHLVLPSGFLPSGFSTKILYVFLLIMWHGKEINLNHCGILCYLGPAFGTFVYDFQNYVFRKKHVAVDKSKMSVWNICCKLLRLDTGSWSPAGPIDLFVRTLVFLSLRHLDILQTVYYFGSPVERP